MALLGVAICACLIFYFYWKGYCIYKRASTISKDVPRVYSLPFPFMDIFGFKKDAEGFFHQTAWSSMAHQTFKAIAIYVGPFPNVIVGGVREVESILSSTREITKSVEYDVMRPWLGSGLLTGAGKRWRARRKLLTPAFHYDILKDFIPVFNEQSRVLISRLADTESAEVNAYPFITLCALDIICGGYHLFDNYSSDYVSD